MSELKPTSTGHWEKQIRNGRAGELAVGARLVELGFDLFWPVNDQPPIDVISVYKSVIKRIQIKTKTQPRQTQLSQEMRVDTVDCKKCDFLICYLVGQFAFYVLPVKAIAGQKTALFYPNGKTNRTDRHDYENYRDAWHLLRE